jgi:hypothetical protein
MLRPFPRAITVADELQGRGAALRETLERERFEKPVLAVVVSADGARDAHRSGIARRHVRVPGVPQEPLAEGLVAAAFPQAGSGRRLMP